MALVVALCIAPGWMMVTRAWQAEEIFSPASGHSQVIAQGVAATTGDVAWRVVFHSLDPGQPGELPAGGPGFVLVDTGGVLTSSRGDSALLAPSEAMFHGERGNDLVAIGDRPAGLFAIDLVPPDAAQETGSGIAVYASKPFAAPSGARDIDLVRDLLEPGESTTVIGNAAPVLLVVTLGGLKVEATDGTSAELQVGEAATFSGDIVVTGQGQAPATFVAAVIGREAPSEAPAAGATPAPVTTGSVQLKVYACPPAVKPESASADTCLRDPEAAAMTLSVIDGPELRDVGPSRERQGAPTWTGLKSGDYALQAGSFKDGFNRFFVRDLAGLAAGAENGFGAGVRGGYRIPIGAERADYSLDVFVFAGSGGEPATAAATPASIETAPPVATGTPRPTEIPSVIEIEPENPNDTPTPRPAPLATATPRPTARPIVTSTAVARPRTGSIQARVFGCLNPIESFNPANCAQALDGFDLRLINEDGDVIGLDQATVGSDGSVVWNDLPLGTYLVQQPLLLPGAATYFIPDLSLANDGSGYLVTIDRDARDAAINVYSLPPSAPPTAAPTVAPAAGADSDLDGLPDTDETGIYGTDPANADSDFDGVTDGAEIAAGTDPLTADAAPQTTGGGDSDGDRLADSDETAYGTDPLNPDSDGDGYFDGDEINLGTNPLDAASVPAG